MKDLKELAERDAGVIALYVGGKTLAQAGEAFGISESAAYQILKRHGVPTRPRYKVGKPERNAAMVAYFLSHPKATLREIGDRFGIHREVARLQLKRAGYSMTGRRKAERAASRPAIGSDRAFH